MKFAAIDIGSNSAKLVFMEILKINDQPHLVQDAIYKVPLKLGADVFNTGKLSDGKQQDLIDTMIAFQKLIEVYKPIEYIAQATSAMRDATNGQQTIQKIQEITGISLQIISGEQEADTLISNYSTIFKQHPDTDFIFVDVGGGSTEIVCASQGEIFQRKSIDIGAVRHRDQLVSENSWDELNSFLQHAKSQLSKIQLVGTGGSIDAVKKSCFPKSNKELSITAIQNLYDELKNISPEERIIKYNVQPDRADLIVPAAYIFLHIMQQLQIDTIQVPKSGLAHGIILNMYQKYTK